MARLRQLWGRIRSIRRRQLAFSLVALAIGFVALMGFLYAWDYTNSPQFCGTTCHTMPPEYTAWQRSPHARVNCVECHLGRDIITTTFTRKAGDLMHVVRYSSGQFTFPLYATTMIPAREACEKCHWPEKFSDDRSVAITHYADDEKNTPITTYLLLKTGGGTERQGQGYGIHWHIENQIDFIATDDLKQNIPWVQVTDSSGKKTTYVDVQNPLTPDEIAKADKRRMDCIDCHNRVSHSFLSPDQAVDQAIELKQIDASIPDIKKKAVEVLSATYSSFGEADKAIDSLGQFYAQNYADYYQGNASKVDAAVSDLKTVYQDLVFPTQDLSWTTHPDNLGHKDWPGCFRCHDGKHFTQDKSQAIRLECNICHTLPVVSKPGGPAPVISLAQSDEPASHKTTTWIAQHSSAFDATCQNCHDTNNAGGSDDSSFCSNSACHGTNWKFAGLDAPAMATVFPPPVVAKPDPNATPPAIPHPIGGSPDCQICHAQTSKVHPYPADHVGRTNDTCLACHKATLPAASASPAAGAAPAAGPTAISAGGPPPIPHSTAGRTECLGCHASGSAGIPQVPQSHKDGGFGNETCLTCHQSSALPSPSPLPTAVAATATPAPTLAPAISVSTSEPVLAPTASASATKEPTLAPTLGAPSSTPASAAGGPPAIPADHAGRTAC
ncbi:MAG: NapC/NirT family cytochrome c, partial [Chloroflexi bacterium]|nr:NapC/NirT family cytochrome c [Chloroflexota bacterium]